MFHTCILFNGDSLTVHYIPQKYIRQNGVFKHYSNTCSLKEKSTPSIC